MPRVAKVKQRQQRWWTEKQHGGLLSRWKMTPEVLGLTHAVRDIYEAITHFIDGRTGAGWASYGQLAAMGAANRRTAIRAVAELEEAGLVAVQYRLVEDPDRPINPKAPVEEQHPWFLPNHYTLLTPRSLCNDAEADAVIATVEAADLPQMVPLQQADLVGRWKSGSRASPVSRPDTSRSEASPPGHTDVPAVETGQEPAAKPSEPEELRPTVEERAEGVALWEFAQRTFGWSRKKPSSRELRFAVRAIRMFGERAVDVFRRAYQYMKDRAPNWNIEWLGGFGWSILATTRVDIRKPLVGAFGEPEFPQETPSPAPPVSAPEPSLGDYKGAWRDLVRDVHDLVATLVYEVAKLDEDLADARHPDVTPEERVEAATRLTEGRALLRQARDLEELLGWGDDGTSPAAERAHYEDLLLRARTLLAGRA